MKIRNLEKRFGKIHALSDVNIDFETGHIYGLLGRNGAGKTTLLNIISDRILPDSGTVKIDGQSIHNNDKALSDIFLATEGNLFGSDSVKSVIEYAGVFDDHFDKDYADFLCERFDLNQKTKVQKLSTGYFTILKSILAIASGASYIFLDEPTLGLDANHRDLTYRTILERFAARDGKCAFILSSHLIDEISSLIDKTVIVDDGKVIVKDDTEHLLASIKVVEGPEMFVRSSLKNISAVAEETILGVTKAYIKSEDTKNLKGTENIKIDSADLQKLFVIMTEGEVQK